MTEGELFSTAIPLDVLPKLLELGLRHGFDPLASVEMENYFLALLANASMDEIEQRIVPAGFRSLGPQPVWLQGADWPLSDGRPMTFAGQVNFPDGSGFPGDPVVYVFADSKTGAIRTVVQRA